MKTFRLLLAAPFALGLALGGAGPTGIHLPAAITARAAVPHDGNLSLSYQVELEGIHCLTSPCSETSGGAAEYAEADAYGPSNGQHIAKPSYAIFFCGEYYTVDGTRYFDEGYFSSVGSSLSGTAGVASVDNTYAQSEANLHAGGFMNLSGSNLDTQSSLVVRGVTVTNNVNDSLVGGRYTIVLTHVPTNHYYFYLGEYFSYIGTTYTNMSCIAQAPASYAENEMEPGD